MASAKFFEDTTALFITDKKIRGPVTSLERDTGQTFRWATLFNTKKATITVSKFVICHHCLSGLPFQVAISWGNSWGEYSRGNLSVLMNEKRSSSKTHIPAFPIGLSARGHYSSTCNLMGWPVPDIMMKSLKVKGWSHNWLCPCSDISVTSGSGQACFIQTRSHMLVTPVYPTGRRSAGSPVSPKFLPPLGTDHLISREKENR